MSTPVCACVVAEDAVVTEVVVVAAVEEEEGVEAASPIATAVAPRIVGGI